MSPACNEQINRRTQSLCSASSWLPSGGAYWFGTAASRRAGRARQDRPRRRPAAARTRVRPGLRRPSPWRPSRSATASMPQTITAVGSLRSDESVTLRPEVAGRVIAIGFQEGQPRCERLDAGPARSGGPRSRGPAGAGEPDPREIEVRARGRPAEERLHLRPGEGRGGKQPPGRRGGAGAHRGAAREDGDPRAVLRHHRPALGVDRRLREGGRGPRQPRIGRSAQGGLPACPRSTAAGAGRADAAGEPGRAAGARLRGQGASRSIRWSTPRGARS